MSLVERIKLIVRTITILLAIATFMLATVQFYSELEDLKQATQKTLKYRIKYNTKSTWGSPQIRSKIDPARVGLLNTKLNIAISQYLVGIAIIAVVSIPVILVTRKRT